MGHFFIERVIGWAYYNFLKLCAVRCWCLYLVGRCLAALLVTCRFDRARFAFFFAFCIIDEFLILRVSRDGYETLILFIPDWQLFLFFCTKFVHNTRNVVMVYSYSRAVLIF